MEPKTLYVAGPTEAVGYNHNAFLNTAQQLTHAGYRPRTPVANPVRNSFEAGQADRLRQILDADGVAVLPGWELSDAATFEVSVAHKLRRPVLTVDQWLQRAARVLEPRRATV
jgi:hypothetical protein